MDLHVIFKLFNGSSWSQTDLHVFDSAIHLLYAFKLQKWIHSPWFMILQYSRCRICQWLSVSRSGNLGSGGHLGRADELFRLSATPGEVFLPGSFFLLQYKHNLLVVWIENLSMCVICMLIVDCLKLSLLTQCRSFVNSVWYIKILSPEDVHKMGKPGNDPRYLS